MGKKKKQKQEVVDYGMSIHFGVCAGPVEYMWGLIVDEKPAWPKDWPKYLRGLTQLHLSLPSLFGGNKKEGGLDGTVTWLPGAADQVFPANLASKFGRTPSTMPAYRGIASIFFSGPGVVRGGGDLPGFNWRSNSPYLPGVWVGVARASEALEIPHARIWRTRRRPSIFIAFPTSTLDAAYLPTIKAAMDIVLDIVSARIAIGEMDIDIAVSHYGLTAGRDRYPHATIADIAALKAWVNGLTAVAFDNRFYWATNMAHDWFNTSAADSSITKRVFMLFTARYPTIWGGSMTAQQVTDEGKGQIADELSRTGGTFNTAANTAVDCYGINIDEADIQYTAQLDNTPDDGVPVIANDADAMAAVILRALGEGAYDSNPAHIIYECLTNTNWGMGAPASAIDVAGFEAASIVLYGENFGLSMMWVQPSSIEDFITEVLDHIEATLFVNPRTGLLQLKLIRNDYSVPALPVFTPDNSTVTNFSRKLWGETINEIVVTWTNPDNEEEETIVAQDLANIEAQGGVISDGRNYYGVRRSDLAARLAHRDLRSASTPLAKCDIEADRSAWDLLPGDCCVLDSPEDGIDLIVMRVGPVDYGKPGDSTVRTSLVEDVFSLALADYSEPPESLWTDPSEDPSPADYTKIVTLPYYVVANLIDPAIVAGVDYPEVFAGILAAEGGQDTETFELYGQATDAAGATTYTGFGTKSITSRATLADPLVAEVETVILAFPDRTQGNGPVIGGLMLIEGADETVSEICLVSDLDVGGWTFVRGVLDTVPRAWPAGTPVWFVDESMTFVDDVDIRAEAETVNYKVLPITSRGTLDESLAPVVSAVMTARPHLPLRPADVTVNGDDGFSGTIDCIGVDPIPVTWARRNRETETAIIQAWDDGDVTPESGQTTTVTLTDMAGAVLHSYSGIAGTSQDVDPADFGGEGEGYIVVSSERDGLSSLQAWRVHVLLVTGVPVDIAVTGLEVTVSVGTVSASGATPVDAAVTGVEATTSVGTVTVSTPPPTDPDFASVVLLCGFEGTDGSTTILDESGAPHTLTAVGTAQIDTAQFKFGSSSLLNDNASNARVTALDNNDWSFGSGAFTIEGWFRFKGSITSDLALVSHWHTTGGQREWVLRYRGSLATDVLEFSYSTAGTAEVNIDTSAWTPTVGQWYHIAVDRSGNDFRIYIDGVMLAKATAAVTLFASSTSILRIGSYWVSGEIGYFDGHIDELRITKGVARYASDAGFAVPTAAFPRS